MAITREQVADLRVGDVVELSGHPEMHGATVTGPLYATATGRLDVGGWIVRWRDGEPNKTYRDRMTLTVISRAPHPLYVNSDKTEPDPGDVVRSGQWTYVYTDRPKWVGSPTAGRPSNWVGVHSVCHDAGPCYDRNLRLLVDGRTGQVVQ